MTTSILLAYILITSIVTGIVLLFLFLAGIAASYAEAVDEAEDDLG